MGGIILFARVFSGFLKLAAIFTSIAYVMSRLLEVYVARDFGALGDYWWIFNTRLSALTFRTQSIIGGVLIFGLVFAAALMLDLFASIAASQQESVELLRQQNKLLTQIGRDQRTLGER